MTFFRRTHVSQHTCKTCGQTLPAKRHPNAQSQLRLSYFHPNFKSKNLCRLITIVHIYWYVSYTEHFTRLIQTGCSSKTNFCSSLLIIHLSSNLLGYNSTKLCNLRTFSKFLHSMRFVKEGFWCLLLSTKVDISAIFALTRRLFANFHFFFLPKLPPDYIFHLDASA